MKDSSVPNVLLSGSPTHINAILMSNPLNSSKLSMRKLIYMNTEKKTAKRQYFR